MELECFFGSAAESKKATWNQIREDFFGIGSKERGIIRRELRKVIKNL